MTPEALAAEKLARAFGLEHLSREALEKLARLLAWVRPRRMTPPTVEHPADIVKPPPERWG